MDASEPSRALSPSPLAALAPAGLAAHPWHCQRAALQRGPAPPGSGPPGLGDSRERPASWLHRGHRIPAPRLPCRCLPHHPGPSRSGSLPFTSPSFSRAGSHLPHPGPASPRKLLFSSGPNSRAGSQPRAPRRSEWPNNRGRGGLTALGTPRVEGAGRARDGVGWGRGCMGEGRKQREGAGGGPLCGRGPGDRHWS